MSGQASVHATSWRSAEAGEVYERGRPGYPTDAVTFIADDLGLGAPARVLDLAAGTGKLTRALAAAGSRMLAAEPMPGMVAQLRGAVPGVPVVAARAEHLPLAAGRLDGITVAQAFHWFDAPAAITEANRVLRAGGHLVLVWNKRDVSVPWVAEMSRVLDRYERLAPRGDMDRWQEAFGATDGFTPLARRAFHHEHVLPDLRDRVASMSFVLVLAEPERQALLGEIDALVAGEAEVRMPYDTHVYWCTRR